MGLTRQLALRFLFVVHFCCLNVLESLFFFLGDLLLYELLLPPLTFSNFLTKVLELEVINPVLALEVGYQPLGGALFPLLFLLLLFIIFHDFEKPFIVLAQNLLIFSERIIEEIREILRFLDDYIILLVITFD